MFLTVTCNPALDWMMRLPAFAEGVTNRSAADDLSYGGKGVNVATMLHRFGQDACASGFIAGTTGTALVEGVEAAGVPCDFVRLDAGQTRINVKMKRPRADGSLEETEINGCGPAVGPVAIATLRRRIERLGSDDCLVLSGSLAPGCPADLYADLAAAAAEHGARCVVDTTGAALTEALAARPFLVKPNNHELAELAGCDAADEVAVVAAARDLARAGARFVLVSCGAAGALLVDAKGLIARGAAPAGALVNSVGAGDSMVAGFLAGLAGASLPGCESLCPGADDAVYALRLGLAAGSATAFSPSLASAGQVSDLLPVTFVEPCN